MAAILEVAEVNEGMAAVAMASAAMQEVGAMEGRAAAWREDKVALVTGHRRYRSR